MSTIYSDSFLHNLERIRAKNKRQMGRKQENQEHVSEDFQSTLSKLSNNKKDIKQKETEVLASMETGEELALSVLTPDNIGEARGRLSSSLLNARSERAVSEGIESFSPNLQCIEQSLKGVKTTAHSVKEELRLNDSAKLEKTELAKIATIEPILKTDSVPTTPVIVRSRRLKGYNSFVESQPSASIGLGGIKEKIVAAGKYHGVDANLSLAIAEAESSYRSNVVSEDGHKTKGVFQLLDSTGKQMKELHGITEPYNPFDPSMNAFLGVGYLKRLMGYFSKDTKLDAYRKTAAAETKEDLEKLALAAFNAGEGNVVRAQQKAKAAGKNPASYQEIALYLPKSTQKYVDKVLLRKASMSRNSFEELA